MDCARGLAVGTRKRFIAVKCAIKKIESVDDEEIRMNGGHALIVHGHMEPFVAVVDSLMNMLERLHNQIYEQQDVRAMADVAALKISITAADEGAMEVLGVRSAVALPELE